MLLKVSPRWMVNLSQVRAIGHYQDSDDEITVLFIDGEEQDFACDNQITRDGILADIEEVFCPKTLFNRKEDDYGQLQPYLSI